MQIQVWFSNDKYIDIKLFDNDACVNWFKHFNQLNLTGYYDSRIIPNLITFDKPIKDVIDQQWDIILNALTTIRSLGFNIPFEIPATFDSNQATLNLLHRFFTYNSLWYWERATVVNPFDKDFELPVDMSYKEWLGIIDPVNSAVHQLDSFTLTANKNICTVRFPISTIHLRPQERKPTDLDPWISFNEEEQQSNYTYFDYDLPLVVLDRSILGKCVLQSFYEDDDLNAHDCTGRLGSYGGFYVDLNSNRKKIYQSEDFESWIKKHNRELDTLPLDFPIGYVTNYKEMLNWIYTPNLEFKKLVFIEHDK